MQVLTPSGYKHPISLKNGDELCAFDVETGAPIINVVESIDFIAAEDWRQMWSASDEVPLFAKCRINGRYTLFREQSVWRNGTNVVHARNLVVGDVIYDDSDEPIEIEKIEEVIDESLVWYRLHVSGDHSYIVDGVTVHNASRFWVGGTGSLTAINTANWAASTGGAGGQSVPGSADTATWDGASGGGTTTFNFGGTWTVTTVTCGAFTGTLDNSVNNNPVSISGNFVGTGSATRTYKLGTATYTMTGNASTWQIITATNLTYTATGSTISFTGSTGLRGINGSSSVALSHGNIVFGASSGAGRCHLNVNDGASTIASLSVTAPNFVQFPSGVTTTITAAFALVGNETNQIAIAADAIATAATCAAAASSTGVYCSFRDMTFTGSPVATNSFDHGNNSGITIRTPKVRPTHGLQAMGEGLSR